jgi:hypothetical protein
MYPSMLSYWCMCGLEVRVKRHAFYIRRGLVSCMLKPLEPKEPQIPTGSQRAFELAVGDQTLAIQSVANDFTD